MEFELAADADAAGQLGKLKTLTAGRDGRPRSQAIKIVWHDDPDHALLSDGLILAEQRGAWRLDRITPGEATWLPGQPVPVVADAPDLTTLPGPLAPIAAFEGRRTTSVHRVGDAVVTLVIDRGVLRAVTAEHPAARICLSGEEAAVREMALLIARSVSATVPTASLAAEAIALATGRDLPPRHEGAPSLPASLTTAAEALAHILGHLTDVILAHAPAAMQPDESGTEAVHQMRVAVRRARSAISVFRPALPGEALDRINDHLRALATELGPSRDWDVFVEETMPALLRALPDDVRLERLAAAAAKRRRACRQSLSGYLQGAGFRALGIELAWFASARAWHPDTDEPQPSLTEFAGGILQQRWKKLISAGKRMEELDIPALHGVRLRGKRTRYAAEMFATLHRGKATHRFIRRLSQLQQTLGVLNDGAVAIHLLEELGGAGGRHAYAVGVAAGFMAARSEMIRPRIISAFEKFRRQSVYWT